ncbi:hypothetical protein H0H92_007814 [Tricholoma furcatifolium]|nr:hypothetical protein H0H92_007814 [Tricholoma furcatifolium]
MRPNFKALLSLLTVCSSALGATYSLTDNIVGADFNSLFNYEAIADPTNGRVNYVDAATAAADNLTYASGDTFILRADYTTVLTADGPGRNSVRIRSNAAYTTHVAVTWPAVWETDEADWPDGGEIDIVEGVNDQPPNASTLHTSPNCTMPSDRTELGTATYDDCDSSVNGNSGCGVQMNTDLSYGPDFNNNGGGWFAVERNNNAISVWFWARNDDTVPTDLSTGASSVDTDNWGEPQAYFPNTDCDIASHFDANNIIINLTFCGDWAGSSSVYAASGCPSTCVDYVNNNPSAFVDAYFDFASLNIYQ